MRGRKPRPAGAHILAGTFRRDRHRLGEIRASGRPTQPEYLTGRAAALWSEVLPRLPWVVFVDGPMLGLWCVLQAELEADPVAMNSARISQLRSVAAELGMSPSSRTRLPPPPPHWPGDDGDDDRGDESMAEFLRSRPDDDAAD